MTERHRRPIRKDEGREGVAIVIVLGLIAVLMLAAVAFSITMRLERKGSSSYRHGVQASHLARAGLAEAVDEINMALADDGSGKPVLFPEWPGGVMGSKPDPKMGRDIPARVMSRSVRDRYLPASHRHSYTNVTPYWRGIYVDDGGSDVIRGRYAYLVFDVSGLLDANVAGGLSSDDRLLGEDAAELMLHEMTDVDAGSAIDPDASAFYGDRLRLRQFETYDELRTLSPAGVRDTQSLCLYSRSPMGQRLEGNTVIDQTYIGGSASELLAPGADTDIRKAFADSGVHADLTDLAYKNLIDYVDADSVPTDLGDGCTETVPMLNEVTLAARATLAAGGGFTAAGAIQFECFYPFSLPPPDSYLMDYTITFTAGAGNTYTSLVPPEITATGVSIPTLDGARQYGSIPARLAFSATVNPAPTNAAVLDWDVAVKVRIKSAGGDEVDAVPHPFSTAVPLTFSVKAGLNLGVRTNIVEWTECLDPRFNAKVAVGDRVWYPSSNLRRLEGRTGFETYSASATPQQNSLLTYFIANQAAVAPRLRMNIDGDTDLYVANRPLRTVGELGYLGLKQWYSISLYDHGLPLQSRESVIHRVFDHFTVYSNGAPAARGLVNVNSLDEEVLQTAFLEAPGREFNTNAPARLSAADAATVARTVLTNGRYANLSEICDIWPSSVQNPADTEINKEGPIRNSVGLLTLRNNVFIVVLIAESFSPIIGSNTEGFSLASKRAVAEVWRDPFPDADGNHKTFVRMFKAVN